MRVMIGTEFEDLTKHEAVDLLEQLERIEKGWLTELFKRTATTTDVLNRRYTVRGQNVSAAQVGDIITTIRSRV